MLHLGGVICLFSVFLLAGNQHANKISRCRIDREQWLNSILSMEGAMRFGGTPLHELFRESNPDAESTVGRFCHQMAQALCMNVRLGEYSETAGLKTTSMLDRDFYAVWKRSVGLLDSLQLNKNDLMQLGAHLGNCDLQTQSRYLQRYREQLQRQIDSEDEALKRKQSMVKALYISFGIVVALMVL